MHSEYLCGSPSEPSEDKIEKAAEEYVQCNRIFLNFTREFQNPAKDYYNIAKVKELFKYLSERQDFQEMKVSGWSENEESEEKIKEEEEEQEEQDEEKYELESYKDKTSPRGGGQRFVMSRDFWYRKLITLKAQKLDEIALEAKDIPPDTVPKTDTKYMKLVQTQKVFSSEAPENCKDILEEINLFDKSVAKPVEKELKKRFVNVYDNRKFFTKDCN